MSVGAAKRELFQIDLMMMRWSRKRAEEAVRGELVGDGITELLRTMFLPDSVKLKTEGKGEMHIA